MKRAPKHTEMDSTVSAPASSKTRTIRSDQLELPQADRWIDAVNAQGLPMIATALGLEVVRDRSISPCPQCHAKERGSSDTRGPLGMTPDCMGWACFRCKAKGSGIGLIARVKGHGNNPRWSELRAECVRLGLLGGEIGVGIPTTRAAPREPPPPKRPPRKEVGALWAAGGEVLAAEDVAQWLSSRKIDPARLNVPVKSLSEDVETPPWAPGWSQRGYRLLIPLYDANGKRLSIRARNITGNNPKELSPTNYEVRGLVMANRVGLRLLRGKPIEGRPAAAHVREHGVVICEGFPDLMTLAGTPEYSARALFGIYSGAWSADFAAVVPRGTPDKPVVVTVATDADAAGDEFALGIQKTFLNEIRARSILVRRWRMANEE